MVVGGGGVLLRRQVLRRVVIVVVLAGDGLHLVSAQEVVDLDLDDLEHPLDRIGHTVDDLVDVALAELEADSLENLF